VPTTWQTFSRRGGSGGAAAELSFSEDGNINASPPVAPATSHYPSAQAACRYLLPERPDSVDTQPSIIQTVEPVENYILDDDTPTPT
jgi:hypothetical protein